MIQENGCGTCHFVSRDEISHSIAGGVQVQRDVKRAFVQHFFTRAVQQVVGVCVAAFAQLDEDDVDVLR